MEFEDDAALDLFNRAPFGYITTLPDGTIVNINDTLLQLIGSERSQLVGKKRFQDLLTIGGRIYHETHYLPLLLHQKEVQEVNFELRSSAGNTIPVLVNTIVIEKENTSTHFLTTIVDITQRKLYEKELFLAKEQAETFSNKLEKTVDELQHFAHVLSHDVKSPLKNIIGLLELFKSGAMDNDKDASAKYLNLVLTSTKEVLNMVDGILQYHVNSDIENQRPEKIDVKELIQKIMRLADPESQIDLTIKNKVKTVNSYPSLVEMILHNLVVNAIKYNDKPQVKLEFTTHSDNKFYHFAIADNGRGIATEDLEKIFESSKTLNLKDRFNSQGTGLGLANVKRMIEKLGGEIQVESTIEVGSVFSFSILKPTS